VSGFATAALAILSNSKPIRNTVPHLARMCVSTAVFRACFRAELATTENCGGNSTEAISASALSPILLPESRQRNWLPALTQALGSQPPTPFGPHLTSPFSLERRISRLEPSGVSGRFSATVPFPYRPALAAQLPVCPRLV
jgi:hypothetical protein